MKSSRENFIIALESLKVDSHGPDGLWTLLYPHTNNTWFLKGRVFNYGFSTNRKQFPDNTECLEAIRSKIIEEVSDISDEDFEQGFSYRDRISIDRNQIRINFWYSVMGGPGSTPPFN